MSSLQHTVDFSLIRYANCWEDADVLLQGLSLPSGSKVLCIASAGDNALSLLTTGAEQVHAIDLSNAQLYLTELKQKAFEVLQYGELLLLLGVDSCDVNQKKKLYNAVRARLSNNATTYWDKHYPVIESGIIYGGKFEQYFKTFRKYVLPLAHNKAKTLQLLAKKTEAAQQEFYRDEWNTFRFRMLINVFFSKYVMGKYGRDPKFLEQVKIPVAQYIRQKTEAHLQSAICQDNYFLHMIFTGSFSNNLPHYLREENFETIKSNIDKLVLSNISAEEAMEQQEYDAYCLSNIFEYMTEDSFAQIAQSWARYMSVGARIAYWNLMAPRSLSETDPEAYIYNSISKELTAIDKGFFYSRFITEVKK